MLDQAIEEAFIQKYVELFALTIAVASLSS